MLSTQHPPWWLCLACWPAGFVDRPSTQRLQLCRQPHALPGKHRRPWKHAAHCGCGARPPARRASGACLCIACDGPGVVGVTNLGVSRACIISALFFLQMTAFSVANCGPVLPCRARLQLLRFGANIHHVNLKPDGGSALHEAVAHKHEAVVELLLSHGANPFVENTKVPGAGGGWGSGMCGHTATASKRVQQLRLRSCFAGQEGPLRPQMQHPRHPRVQSGPTICLAAPSLPSQSPLHLRALPPWTLPAQRATCRCCAAWSSARPTWAGCWSRCEGTLPCARAGA